MYCYKFSFALCILCRVSVKGQEEGVFIPLTSTQSRRDCRCNPLDRVLVAGGPGRGLTVNISQTQGIRLDPVLCPGTSRRRNSHNPVDNIQRMPGY